MSGESDLTTIQDATYDINVFQSLLQQDTGAVMSAKGLGSCLKERKLR